METEVKTQQAEIHLPITGWVVDGKAIQEPPFQGKTLHIHEQRWQVAFESGSPVAPMSDLKIQVNFCTEAHCFEPIYGKILHLMETASPNTYEMKITAMAEEDREIIDQWIIEGGGEVG